MRVNTSKTLFLMGLIIVGLLSCSGSGKPERDGAASGDSPMEKAQVPVFNADSAFAFIETQVNFGPRVPNTPAHQACGDWLGETLGRFADTLYIQEARIRAFDGTVLNIRNIIGSFQPERRNRILLCAHWDSL
jgi:hypothetical protein